MAELLVLGREIAEVEGIGSNVQRPTFSDIDAVALQGVVILFGGMLGPLFLMLGLSQTSASSG